MGVLGEEFEASLAHELLLSLRVRPRTGVETSGTSVVEQLTAALSVLLSLESILPLRVLRPFLGDTLEGMRELLSLFPRGLTLEGVSGLGPAWRGFLEVDSQVS